MTSDDIKDMRARAFAWASRPSADPNGEVLVRREDAINEEHLALDVLELIAEIERLRETLAHSCTCSLADGAAPALRHEPMCELRIAKTKRIDPALALSRFAKAMDSGDEVEGLQAKLAAVTAARDEARYNAKILAHAYEHDSRPPARVVAQASAYPARPEGQP